VTSKLTKALVPAAFAVVGWAWCGAVVAVGRQFLPMQATLMVHAVAGPLGIGLLSATYTRRFGFTAPPATAGIFLGVVVALDALVVAPVFEHSYAMFASVLGTWIPFALIFVCSYAGARWAIHSKGPSRAEIAGR